MYKQFAVSVFLLVGCSEPVGVSSLSSMPATAAQDKTTEESEATRESTASAVPGNEPQEFGNGEVQCLSSRFVPHGTASFTDSKTGLEWLASDQAFSTEYRDGCGEHRVASTAEVLALLEGTASCEFAFYNWQSNESQFVETTDGCVSLVRRTSEPTARCFTNSLEISKSNLCVVVTR